MSPLLHLLLLLTFHILAAAVGNQTDAAVAATKDEEAAVRLARHALLRAKSWVSASMTSDAGAGEAVRRRAWADCMQLYEDSESRIGRVAGEYYDVADARTWLSAALTRHTTCVDGLRERNVSAAEEGVVVTALLREALAMHVSARKSMQGTYNQRTGIMNSTALPAAGLLVSWDADVQSADIVVAKDGSGRYSTISEAVSAVPQWQRDDRRRIVIYVKSGVYEEHVEIKRDTRNVMLIGDGIDKTVVTGHRSVPDGYTTFASATFGVTSDSFWARDMTFENTAGPEKHQAVALRVDSDRSVFYRCSFKGYQDTLFVLSQRQFYRDCDIYGTVDFIFGNAAAVLQNCNIIVRRPMSHQGNMITAQARDDPNQNTGISIHASRVMPAKDFESVKESFKSYLGRPWKKYSRAVFMKTDLDGLIHPDGWARWSGDFAIDTLYYGEYQNTGYGAAADQRVKWPGFHLIDDSGEAGKFTVESFIQGDWWLPETGVPFWSGL